MLRINFIFSILCISLLANAQNLIPFQKDEKHPKWGYCDPDGKVVIKPQFDEAYPFTKGFALVSKDEKYGYIGTNGKPVLKIEYEEIRNFQDGLAAVKKGDKWGYINEQLTIVIKPEYTAVGNFNALGHVWVAKGGKLKNGQLDGCKYGLLDRSGKVVVPIEYNALGICKPVNYVPTKETMENWSNIRKRSRSESGDWVLKEPSVENLTNLQILEVPEGEGYWISKNQNGKKNGLIDNVGNIIVQPGKYDVVSWPSDGIAPVKNGKNQNYLYVATGQLMFKKDQPVTCYEFQDGVAIIKNKDSKYYLIDKNGTFLSDGYYYVFPKNDSYCVVTNNIDGTEKFGLINTDGTIILPCEQEAVFPKSNGLFLVRLAGQDKYGYMDGNANWVIQPQYQNAYSFSHGYAYVANNDKWGLIKDNGDIAIPTEWNSGKFFYIDNPKFTFLQLEDKGYWYMVNLADGMPVKDHAFENVSYNFGYPIAECAVVFNGQGWGAIDQNGEWVLDPVFSKDSYVKDAFDYKSDKNINNWSTIHSVRFNINKLEDRNKHNLNEVIPDEHWDF